MGMDGAWGIYTAMPVRARHRKIWKELVGQFVTVLRGIGNVGLTRA